LGSNVRWNLLGSGVYGAGQWLQVVILAHLGGSAAVGVYAFGLALSQPVMMFASLQARTLQASDPRREYTFREYRRLRAATTFVAMLALGVIAWATRRSAWPVLVPIFAMRAADAMTDIYYGEWQRHERMSVNGFGMALNASSSVGFMALAAALGGGVPGAAVGALLGSCLTLAFIHLRTATDHELRLTLANDAPTVRWNRVGRLAVGATPLGINVFLHSLQQNVPLYFIQHLAGDAALGLFAAAYQLTAAGGILIGALASAAVPRFAAMHAAGDAVGFRRFVRKLVAVGLILGAAGVALSLLLGREVLILLYRPEFAAGAPTLVVLSVAAGIGFAASFLGYALTTARIIAVQPFVLGLTLVVLAAASAVLVPRQGAVGAAWALVLGLSAQVMMYAMILRGFRAKRPEAQAQATP
jgi:O-antigen/teichoic acid export membrane protein